MDDDKTTSSPANPPGSLPKGTVIAGRFILEGLAGRGGMGFVYRAIDSSTGGTVALKLLHGVTSPEVAYRFKREAVLLAELRHPGIVSYVAHGSTGVGQPYLAMEWLDGEDLSRRLARQPLGLPEAIGYYMITATAGHDTTSHTTASGLWALAERPELLRALKADPSLIPAHVDESVRWATAVKHFMRNCQAPLTMRGVTFEPGDLLYLAYASANRDDEVFPDPDRLDVTRENAAGHVAFGFGRHFCLGAHLARMEIRAILRELVGRIDHVELAGEPTWTHAYFVEGPKSIPIRYRVR